MNLDALASVNNADNYGSSVHSCISPTTLTISSIAYLELFAWLADFGAKGQNGGYTLSRQLTEGRTRRSKNEFLAADQRANAGILELYADISKRWLQNVAKRFIS